MWDTHPILTEMAAHFAPAFRTPFTDLTGGVLTHQSSDKCPHFEMNFVKCVEAYGHDKGKDKCQDYLDDLRECLNEQKQLARVGIMRAERYRQFAFEDRKYKDLYAPGARIDGF